MNEKEIDMSELIECFKEYRTEFNKTTCKYYKDYLRNYQKEKIWQIEEYQKAVDKTMSEKIDLEHNWNELKRYVKELLGSKYIHKYDVLDKMKELEEGGNNENNTTCWI